MEIRRGRGFKKHIFKGGERTKTKHQLKIQEKGEPRIQKYNDDEGREEG